MLVLTRKINEQISIGEDITITVTRISGGRCRLGIEAPKDIKILRKELPVIDLNANHGSENEAV